MDKLLELSLVSIPEAADLLSIPTHEVWWLIKTRRLSLVRIKKRNMISIAELRKFIRKHTYEASRSDHAPCDIVFD